MRLSFHATRVREEIDEEVQTLVFEVEADGDPRVYFGMMNEPGAVESARVWWARFREGADDCVVAFAAAALESARFTADFAEPQPVCMGPYTGVDITFDELDPTDLRAAKEALHAIMGRP